MKKTIAMADNCIDVYYKLDRYYLTGNSIDFALNYKDLGGDVTEMTILGNDVFALALEERLKERGIPLRVLARVDRPTGMATMDLVDGDKMHLHFKGNAMEEIRLSEEDQEYVKQFDIVYAERWTGIDRYAEDLKQPGQIWVYDFSKRLELESNDRILPYIDYAFFSYDRDDEYIRSFMVKTRKKCASKNGAVIARTYDSLARPTGYSLRASAPLRLDYSYDPLGRFSGVGFNAEAQSGGVDFEYSYLPNTDLISGKTATTGDNSAFCILHSALSYEPHRDLISAVTNAAFNPSTLQPFNLSTFAYLNDALGRRVEVTRTGAAFGDLAGATDAYGYNLRSEVVSSRRTLSDSPVRGFDYDYAYDPIGNRTSATDYDEQGNALVSSYTANALNQYTSRTVPGYAALRGEARELRQRRTAAIPYAPHIYSIRLICPPSSFNDIDFSESSSDTSRIVNAA